MVVVVVGSLVVVAIVMGVVVGRETGLGFVTDAYWYV